MSALLPPLPPVRAEYERPLEPVAAVAVERPLSLWNRLLSLG